MNLPQAIRTGFTKYATFHGRATRSEFWYWQVFSLLVYAVSALATLVPAPTLALAHETIFTRAVIITIIFATLALVLPGIAVGVRRLHDSNMSGWWQLITFVPAVGWIAWIILMAQPSGPTPNRFE
jgi:uncharacterized membrane protein YhaH (DUF805 family)